jgi:hypothetical protein
VPPEVVSLAGSGSTDPRVVIEDRRAGPSMRGSCLLQVILKIWHDGRS